MEPNPDFWKWLFFGVLVVSLIGIIAGVFILKFFVFRPAEKRAKREADADGSFGPIERIELVSLIRKLDDRSEENIVAREIAKNKFLEDFRQELLAPLVHIKRESSVLSQFVPDDTSAIAAREIHRSATRLEGLILDLYELYTLEVDRARLTQETLSVQTLLDEISEYFKLIAMETGNELRFEVGPKVKSIVTDYSKFKKLLESLIEAANSFTKQDIILTEIDYAEDGRLMIRVSDSGKGRHMESVRNWSGLRLPLIKKLAEFLGGGFTFQEKPNGKAVSTAVISVRSN